MSIFFCLGIQLSVLVPLFWSFRKASRYSNGEGSVRVSGFSRLIKTPTRDPSTTELYNEECRVDKSEVYVEFTGVYDESDDETFRVHHSEPSNVYLNPDVRTSSVFGTSESLKVSLKSTVSLLGSLCPSFNGFPISVVSFMGTSVTDHLGVLIQTESLGS